MKYIQNWFRGDLRGAIHIIKGPHETDAANVVETWCGQVFQDRTGLQRDQGTSTWRQGFSSDQIHTLCQVPRNWWRDNRGVCSECLKVLEIQTNRPGELAAMDNDVLYQEFRDAHESDDWEGAFTTAGKLRLQMGVAEMERRLRECGFLSGEGQQ